MTKASWFLSLVVVVGVACSAADPESRGDDTNGTGGEGPGEAGTGTGGSEPGPGGGAGTGAVAGAGATGGADSGTGGTVIPDVPGLSPPEIFDIRIPRHLAGAPPRVCDICEDFPAAPIFIDDAPANAPDLFGSPDNVNLGSGPCIFEPEPGTLFPYNWLRPRIRWAPMGNLYEVRISTPRQADDLVVYTPRTEYYIPREVWYGVPGVTQGLAKNNYDEEIMVTVRSIDTAAPGTPAGSQTYFTAAPVEAGGSMVYWAITSTDAADSWLKGFAVGDESTVDTLVASQVQSQTREWAAHAGEVTCIGCHTSTPDGDAVAFVADYPWSSTLAYVTEERVGELPDYITPAGQLPIQQMWLGIYTFSPAQWEPGRRLAVVTYGDPTDVGWNGSGEFNESNQDRLMWVNLEADGPLPIPTEDWLITSEYIYTAEGQSFGFVARNGDARAANSPDWSQDGTQIAYTSTSTTADGCIGAVNDTDIYLVPFNEGAGGDAVPLPGASQTDVAEYYPAFSSDDAFVAFNRVDGVSGLSDAMYYRPEGEVWIVPARGPNVAAAAGELSVGGAIRLKANDPNACCGDLSPGSINSYPKWSPRADTVDGKTYYWLIFSSARESLGELPKGRYSPPDTRMSQLYMTAFTVENGEVTTYPAVYLWNQSTDTSNLTPAWDDFDIPDVPPPPIIR